MATKTKKMKTVKLDGAPPSAPTRTVVKTGTGGYFRKVESNVKGGVSVPLSPCTAIVSDKNRAGKTAVLDSIRLALAGNHPVGPHAADLAGLTADGALPWAKLLGDAAGAELEFPSGRKTAKHELTGGLAGLDDQQRANLLPQVAMRDLLTLGTAKAREELFRRFGSGVDELSAEGLDDAQTALFQNVLAQAKGDPVQRVTEAGTILRSHKRSLSERLKVLEEEKSRLSADASESGLLTDAQIAELEQVIQQHAQYKRAAALREQVMADAAVLDHAAEAFQQMDVPLTDEQVAERLDNLPEFTTYEVAQREYAEAVAANKPSERGEVLAALTMMRKLLAETGSCVVCAGTPAQDPATLLAKAEAALAAERAGAITAQQRVQEATRNMDLARANWDRAVRIVREQASAYRSEYERAKGALTLMAERFKANRATLESIGGVTAPAMDEASAHLKLDAARTAATFKVRAAETAGLIRQVKNEQANAKAVEAVLADAMNMLAESVKARAQNAVNEWMPEGFRAVLQLEDTEGKPACRWEIVGSDGRPHPRGAASGAEWSALTVAIACAWSDGAPFRFLLLDDTDIAGFSAENVRNLLDTVAAAVKDGRLTQAFVAWSRPAEIPDEGWSVVAL